MSAGIVTIKQGREKPIIQQHPWIFSGAITSAHQTNPGEIVTVQAHDGRFLARGYWNAKSQIQVRILTWQDEPIDDAWWRKPLQRAIDSRPQDNPQQTAYRLINAENDYIPGLIVDRYADWLVIQALTLFIDTHKQYIADLLAELLPVKGIYERSDVDVRGKEGLKSVKGVLWGEAPPQHILINEQVQFNVDVYNGHKTGFYLDQAPNRQLLQQLLTDKFAGETTPKLLNLFSYTGGFGINALAAGGAQVTNVDSSQDALALAEQNIRLNGFQPEDTTRQWENIQSDVFDYLHQAVADEKQFDVIVCDPPKFANNKQQVDKAARGYKDLNLNAFKLVKPGGYFLTFSCSGAISADLFQKIVFGALADTGRQAQIIKHLGPGEDHPVALTFPEGEYLKGLLLRVY